MCREMDRDETSLSGCVMWGSGLRKGLMGLATLGLALLTVAPASAQNPYPRKSDSDPHEGVVAAKRMPIQGIDVSWYQKDIDWQAVKRAGTRFAFIKATEGGDLLDRRFRENWEEARAAGVPRGAYHFVFWCRPAKDQVRWFIRNVPKEQDALPPVLDVEWSHKTSCQRPSAEKARAKMREMLRAFEAHYGKKPVIYTDINFHEDVLEGTTEFDHYPFWIRSVAAKPKERYGDRPWEFWQFTATGRVPGVVGDVDRNAFYGTEKQFTDWVQGRYDIGLRRPMNGTPRPTQEQAQALPQPVSAKEPAPAPRPVAFTPRPRPVSPRVETRRRDYIPPIPPGIVPDVTGSIRR
jgi:lysozyme